MKPMLLILSLSLLTVSGLMAQTKPAAKAATGDIEKGKALYAKLNCQTCHSAAAIAPAMKDVIGKYKDADALMKMLAAPVKSGKYPAAMPPVKVTKDEAKQLLAFIQDDVKKAAKPGTASDKTKKTEKKN